MLHHLAGFEVMSTEKKMCLSHFLFKHFILFIVDIETALKNMSSQLVYDHCLIFGTEQNQEISSMYHGLYALEREDCTFQYFLHLKNLDLVGLSS
jgi:hypothetical protein